MYMDKVKNFYDHSMILWEMAANQKSKGTLWPTPASFRVKAKIHSLYMRAVADQERVIVARVRYI